MEPDHIIEVAGLHIPVYAFDAIIIGSGAAGLNCAEHLHELGVTNIAIVTARLGGGTSANAGSDKQTYYKVGVFGDVPDSPLEMARALTVGGMCHGDLAYVEALGSLPEFYHLVRNGVEFPHNRYGAYVGYKTDHDPRQRATSAGPKTSVQMVQRSLAQVRRNGTPIFDGHEVVRLLLGRRVGAPEVAPMPTILGALAIDRSRLAGDDLGLVVLLADRVVLAAGGCGEMYRDSVYPPGQVGGLGLALEVGARANNLTESQFGLASTGFRWNLSGTYQQVIPCYFSTNGAGWDVRYFLNEYFPTMRQEATAIFLKGYQWPFSAERLQDYGSSLIDLAVHQERLAGRNVYLDFTRNPVATGGLEEFSLESLGPEARSYLERSGALQGTPIQRLEHMNPLAIEVYAEHGVDLRHPLPIAVCAQHCNGGLTVDIWWRTTVRGLYAIGEAAGTHGVRPGGSALNAGQVGGLRAAQHIAHVLSPGTRPAGRASERIASDIAAAMPAVERGVQRILRHLNAGRAAPTIGEVRLEIQARMSEHAAFIRSLQGVSRALEEAYALSERLAGGQRLSGREQLVAAVQNEHLCLTHTAFLVAIQALLKRGGGSRGSYLVLDDAGDRIVESKRGLQLRYRSENMALRQEVLEVQLGENGRFAVFVTPVRPLPADDSWYENTWREWREGRVFADEE